MNDGRRQMLEAISLASTMGFSIVVNAAVGLLLGKGIDKLLNSSPWGVAIGVALGLIAGIRSVCRKAADLDVGEGNEKK